MNFPRSATRAAGRNAAAAALGALLATAPAAAAPLDDPHVGGFFGGPTSGNLAAVYWNPAALGLMHGSSFTWARSLRLQSTTVDRTAIDPATGAPGGSAAAGSATASDAIQPQIWPGGPGGFAGAATDLSSTRITLAFATYTPFVEQRHYALAAGDGEPTRYHALDVDLRHVALVPALAVRIAGDFRIGFAPGVLLSTGAITFDEDTALDGGSAGLRGDCGGAPCGAENPAAAARYRIASGNGPGDASFALTVAGGLFYRRGRWDFGASYTSRPLLSNADGVLVEGNRGGIDLPARASGGTRAPLPCPVAQPHGCVSAEMAYQLPDVFVAGVAFHARPSLEVGATVRFLTLSLQKNIDIRLTGATIDAAGLPEHIVLYRGFRDVWEGRVHLITQLADRMRAGVALRVETSAVPSSALSPAAVDGLTVEPYAMAEVIVLRWLLLGAGYGFTWMPSVDSGASVFDPTAATACADAGGDLRLPSCRTRLDGAARPTAAGRYSLHTQTFSLSATARF